MTGQQILLPGQYMYHNVSWCDVLSEKVKAVATNKKDV